LIVLRLYARPLRRGMKALVPLLGLPGLLISAAQVPQALLLLGPLVIASWALMRRDRSPFERCVVEVDGPALTLHKSEAQDDTLLLGLDLRYAERHESPNELILSEGQKDAARFVAFGTDPPENVAPPGNEEFFQGTWCAVRLFADDLAALLATVESVAKEPPPDPERPATLLAALGSVGPMGPWAEQLLLSHLRREQTERPDGIGAALRALALLTGPAAKAARRILLKTDPNVPLRIDSH
jgi:hypothetical protein